MVNIGIGILEGSLEGTNIVVNFSTNVGTATGQLFHIYGAKKKHKYDFYIIFHNN